jgi:hypothetical protein
MRRKCETWRFRLTKALQKGILFQNWSHNTGGAGWQCLLFMKTFTFRPVLKGRGVFSLRKKDDKKMTFGSSGITIISGEGFNHGQ